MAILTAGRCISICPPGTGFRAPETPASKWPCSRKRPVSETANETKVPPIQGQFACLQERSAKSGLRGGGGSRPRNRSLRADSLLNREKCREFGRKRQLFQTISGVCHVNSNTYPKIPTRRTANSLPNNRGWHRAKQGLQCQAIFEFDFSNPCPPTGGRLCAKR